MMQVRQNRTHPIVLIAATGLTIFSILGSAAITGLIPSSHHQSHQGQNQLSPGKPGQGKPSNAETINAGMMSHSGIKGEVEKVSMQVDAQANSLSGPSHLSGILAQKNVILPLPLPNLQATTALKLNNSLGLSVEEAAGMHPQIKQSDEASDGANTTGRAKSPDQAIDKLPSPAKQDKKQARTMVSAYGSASVIDL